ncbi:MAG TPA: hypothetical protein PLA71_00010 [Saccharofermentans sp.]|nr:hypothetical protein [Saccharofermentans sp.]
MNVTPEQIYEEYHIQTIYAEKKIHVKPIKNFEKARQRADWTYFEQLAKRLETNDNLDYRILITALVLHYRGRFDASLLTSLKGLKIYRGFVDKTNNMDDYEKIYELILSNIKNVVQWCKKEGIRDLDGYLYRNMETIPTIAFHFNSGLISAYFLAIVPNILCILKNLPLDIVDEYFYSFIESYEIYRSKVVRIKAIYDFSTRFEANFNKLLE